MSLTVQKPGLLSTFQDEGRAGFQHQGIPAAGAMDARAHRLANVLAGNTADEATLEITLMGPVLRFEAPACIALAGADLGATLDGEPLPLLRPLVVRAGAVLAFGAPQTGTRAYLAVHGGFALDPVMGSYSTYLRSGFGGFQGRALARGDRVGFRHALTDEPARLDALARELWELRIYLPATLRALQRSTVRFLPGLHWDEFNQASRHAFAEGEYRISAQSDRMGYRLDGPTLAMTAPRQILSEATSFGTVQVPAGGQPIVLMADRQTTGGYPKLAQIAAVDLPVLAQFAPGQTLRFAPIALDEAQQLDAARAQAFAALEAALAPLRAQLAGHVLAAEKDSA
ncbi:MAG: biotin-dependent carboxyltransferase family protein [Bordetella sp.]|nr:biotin-dependent carboxyltransferase family protein [Bordetella sp.]